MTVICNICEDELSASFSIDSDGQVMVTVDQCDTCVANAYAGGRDDGHAEGYTDGHADARDEITEEIGDIVDSMVEERLNSLKGD
jgi:hypothetical protein